ncbi:MAG: ribosome silencing factor [Candidatus Bipolaricaulota bacterium]|nr:ribosome silencing factor [Candidatus Bipolaricaulota bacterium]
MDDDRLLRSAIDLISEKKGKNTVVIDLRNSPIPTDYFVITEGENRVHVKAIVSSLMSELPLKAIHREGLSERRWIVLDYGELMVHIFVREAREFYDIESLWADHIIATAGR